MFCRSNGPCYQPNLLLCENDYTLYGMSGHGCLNCTLFMDTNLAFYRYLKKFPQIKQLLATEITDLETESPMSSEGSLCLISCW